MTLPRSGQMLGEKRECLEYAPVLFFGDYWARCPPASIRYRISTSCESGAVVPEPTGLRLVSHWCASAAVSFLEILLPLQFQLLLLFQYIPRRQTLNLIGIFHFAHRLSDAISSLRHWISSLTLAYGLHFDSYKLRDLSQIPSTAPRELFHPNYQEYILQQLSKASGGSSDSDCTLSYGKPSPSLIWPQVQLCFSSSPCGNYGCGVHRFLPTTVTIQTVDLSKAFLSPGTVYQSLSSHQDANAIVSFRKVSLLDSPLVNIYLGPSLPAGSFLCRIPNVIDHRRFRFRSPSPQLFSLLAHPTEFAFWLYCQ